MSEVDIAEELPNGDDSAFEDQQSNSEVQSQQTLTSHTIPTSIPIVSEADAVYVTSSHDQELLPPDYQDEKTTHIVIHDQGGGMESGLKSPTTPLPPPTPATPMSREKGLRYQWDESVDQEILPVRCKNTNGELFKSKFGSGESSLLFTSLEIKVLLVMVEDRDDQALC